MDNTLDDLKARAARIAADEQLELAVNKAKEPPFRVGDWVEAVKDDAAKPPRFLKGVRGIIFKLFDGQDDSGRDAFDGCYVEWKSGNWDKLSSPEWNGQAFFREIRRIGPPTKTAPLKRKEGDIVLMAVRIVEVFEGAPRPYHVEPIQGYRECDCRMWVSRNVLEAEE